MSSSDQPVSGDPPLDRERAQTAANRFDLRRIIGGLLVLYGIVLTIVGIVATHAVKTKAAGVNINLWAGLGMLVAGAVMIAWALLRPVEIDAPPGQ